MSNQTTSDHEQFPELPKPGSPPLSTKLANKMRQKSPDSKKRKTPDTSPTHQSSNEQAPPLFDKETLREVGRELFNDFLPEMKKMIDTAVSSFDARLATIEKGCI